MKNNENMDYIQKRKLYESIMGAIAVHVKHSLNERYALTEPYTSGLFSLHGRYILESLVNSQELNRDLRFVETTLEEVDRMVDSDDYNHGKIFSYKDDVIMPSDCILNDLAKCYRIQYKENILGFFTYVDGNTLFDEFNKRRYFVFLRMIYSGLIYNLLFPEYKRLDVVDYDYINEYRNKFRSLKDDNERFKAFDEFIEQSVYNKKPLFSSLVKPSGYIGYWIINQKMKRHLDINDYALVKIFFNMLLKFLRERNCKYIFACGKDMHTKDMYVKLGGFEYPYDLFAKLRKLSIENKEHVGLFNLMLDEEYDEYTNTLVIRKV